MRRMGRGEERTMHPAQPLHDTPHGDGMSQADERLRGTDDDDDA